MSSGAANRELRILLVESDAAVACAIIEAIEQRAGGRSQVWWQQEVRRALEILACTSVDLLLVDSHVYAALLPAQLHALDACVPIIIAVNRHSPPPAAADGSRALVWKNDHESLWQLIAERIGACG